MMLQRLLWPCLIHLAYVGADTMTNSSNPSPEEEADHIWKLVLNGSDFLVDGNCDARTLVQYHCNWLRSEVASVKFAVAYDNCHTQALKAARDCCYLGALKENCPAVDRLNWQFVESFPELPTAANNETQARCGSGLSQERFASRKRYVDCYIKKERVAKVGKCDRAVDREWSKCDRHRIWGKESVHCRVAVTLAVAEKKMRKLCSRRCSTCRHKLRRILYKETPVDCYKTGTGLAQHGKTSATDIRRGLKHCPANLSPTPPPSPFNPWKARALLYALYSYL